MEKYLKIILTFLIIGMGISLIGDRIIVFYLLLGGAIILIFFDAKQKRNLRKSKND